jgi:hypothetical protein
VVDRRTVPDDQQVVAVSADPARARTR